MVERLIVFEVCCGYVGVVVVVVQMKTVGFRRSCIPEVRLQMKVQDVFDVEGNDVVIGVVIGVVLVVEVVAVVPVDLVVVAVAEDVPLETGAVVAEH